MTAVDLSPTEKNGKEEEGRMDEIGSGQKSALAQGEARNNYRHLCTRRELAMSENLTLVLQTKDV